MDLRELVIEAACAANPLIDAVPGGTVANVASVLDAIAAGGGVLLEKDETGSFEYGRTALFRVLSNTLTFDPDRVLERASRALQGEGD